MHELVALAVDRLGIAASAEEYPKAPKPLPRPDWTEVRDTGPAEPEVQGTGVRRAISVLAGSAKRVLG